MSTSVAVDKTETSADRVVSPHRRGIAGVAAGLTTVKVIGAASGIISGPLLARSLGPTGRGDLAAITVPLALVPALAGLGISSYAFRARPRGWSSEEVVGSLGLPLIGLGLLLAALAVPIADSLAGGRDVVRFWLIITFLSMPLVMFGDFANSAMAALERWRSLTALILIPFMVPFAAIVILSLMGRLTVSTAAAFTIAGSVLAILPGLPLLTRRPVFKPSLARTAVSFGIKGWVGGVALTANRQLDQFMMITLVAPRVLGLYAVAATLAGAPLLAIASLSTPLMTRVAAGERRLVPQAVRLAMVWTALTGLMLAAVSPVLLSVLFGPSFSAAAPMAVILLVAQVPYSGSMVFSSALQADGAPSIPTIAEALSLVVTVGGLLLLLGPLGGIGAALVSVAAYATSFALLLWIGRRRIHAPLREFLVPSRADVQAVRGLVSHASFGFRNRIHAT